MLVSSVKFWKLRIPIEICRRHERTHSADDDGWTCRLCEKVFRRKEHLDKHFLTHSGAKSFACPVEVSKPAWNQPSIKKLYICSFFTGQTLSMLFDFILFARYRGFHMNSYKSSLLKYIQILANKRLLDSPELMWYHQTCMLHISFEFNSRSMMNPYLGLWTWIRGSLFTLCAHEEAQSGF